MTTLHDAPIAEITRGPVVESVHLGAAIVCDPDGRVLFSIGDTETPTYPRSAVKALLALPLIETGAADLYALDDAELALACASHNGEPEHAATAARTLARLGLDAGCLECGTHWPVSNAASRDLAAAGEQPTPLHNNCSGKHAGFICTACAQGTEVAGYISAEHPIMRQATRVLEEMTGVAHDERNRGIDGCSIPTYAIPLRATATAFARFATGKGLSPTRAQAATRLRQAVAANPFMIGGTGTFDTKIMTDLGTAAFTKMGAEGIMIAALPETGLGIAIKSRDGGLRAAEAAMAALLKRFGGSVCANSPVVQNYIRQDMKNWNGLTFGEIRAAAIFNA